MSSVFFHSDFVSGDPRPFGIYGASPTYVENAARDVNGISSAGAAGGQFWWDNNHIHPGRGWLQLMHILWCETGSDPLSRQGVIPRGDIRGGSVVARMKTGGNQSGFYLPKKTRIGLWVQCWVPECADGEGRYVNLFQTRDLVCSQLGVARPMKRNNQDAWMKSENWVDCQISLDPNPENWICLGSSVADAAKYGCSSPDRVLSDFNHNMGIIAFMGEPSQPNAPPAGYSVYPLGYAGGESWIDSFTINLP